MKVDIVSQEEALKIMSLATSATTSCIATNGGKSLFVIAGLLDGELKAVGYYSLCVGFAESTFVNSDLMDGIVAYHSNKLSSKKEKSDA